jgi:hypothetical protein
MSITSTYVSGTSFTVSTDRTADFVQGRAVYCDCGVDGIKYGYVSYSSYSAPDTTIYLDSIESQAITNNLVSVLFSRIISKETGGNAPVQQVWMQRGFKSGLILSYKDADEIYIDSGALHIDDGTSENIYCAQSQLTKQLTSLSASTWYAIYVDPPTNGLSLAAEDIEYSSTMPTYNQAKRGWYHPTTTDWRCIGFIKSDGSSAVLPFMVAHGFWMFTDYSDDDISGATPSNSWTEYTAPVPIGDVVAEAQITPIYNNAYTRIVCRKTGTIGNGIRIAVLDSTAANKREDFFVKVSVDSSKHFDMKWETATTNTIWMRFLGFYLPVGI